MNYSTRITDSLRFEGVSLFEMMVTIVIVSILSGSAYITLGPLWKKHEIGLVASDLTGHIQSLRLRAILEGVTYQMMIEDSSLKFKKATSAGPWRKIELGESVHCSLKGRVLFSSRGFTSPKTIFLSTSKFKQNVIININGRVRRSEIY